VSVDDRVGIVTSCLRIPGPPPGKKTWTASDLDIRRNAVHSLEASWIIANCDRSALLRLTALGQKYHLTVEDQQDGPCSGGSGAISMSINLEGPVDADRVVATLTRTVAPSP
jgi:hypothetical protein